ncbi:MAG: hypothetical protein IT364_05805 [Candidatus Hydrogenedentes bacterium]|nr:hypothetical protein [Candidatus Hydrogenedentota bacterium]
MTDEGKQPKGPVTLGMHLRRAFKEAHRRRPVSFYLLLAIIVALLLGLQIVHVKENPRQFALLLSLLFIFFFAVMVRAIVDFGDIFRRHLSEHEKVFKTTLGEEEFVSELGKRVSEKQEKP